MIERKEETESESLKNGIKRERERNTEGVRVKEWNKRVRVRERKRERERKEGEARDKVFISRMTVFFVVQDVRRDKTRKPKPSIVVSRTIHFDGQRKQHDSVEQQD